MHVTSKSRPHAVASESERESDSEVVPVGTTVKELESETILDSELLLLVEKDEDRLSVTTRESDPELVAEIVACGRSAIVEESVAVKVVLMVDFRVCVSDDVRV